MTVGRTLHKRVQSFNFTPTPQARIADTASINSYANPRPVSLYTNRTLQPRIQNASVSASKWSRKNKSFADQIVHSTLHSSTGALRHFSPGTSNSNVLSLTTRGRISPAAANSSMDVHVVSKNAATMDAKSTCSSNILTHNLIQMIACSDADDEESMNFSNTVETKVNSGTTAKVTLISKSIKIENKPKAKGVCQASARRKDHIKDRSLKIVSASRDPENTS